MKVVSTNIGEKRAIFWQGKELFTGIYKYPVNEGIFLGETDVDNDDVIDRRYHGGIDKACYAYSADHYKFWKDLFPESDWVMGMFGENLTIENMDESKIHIGATYKLGSAVVQVTQPRQPCFKLGVRFDNPKVVKKFVEAELPGVYFRVIKPGDVKPRDTFMLIENKPENFTVKEIFHFLYNSKANVKSINHAIQITELAESCRKDLEKLL